MKLRFFAVLLLAIAFTRAASACDSMKPYLDELSAGRKPSAPPVVKDCDKPDTAAVAAALAAFIEKSASADDVDDVVEEIQSTYAAKDWTRSYAALAVALETHLPNYKHYASEYALLDNLSDYFEGKHPQPQAAPKPLPQPRRIAQVTFPKERFPWIPWSILGAAILLAPIPVIATIRLIRRAVEGARAQQDELARRLSATASKFDSNLQFLDEQLQMTSSGLGAKVQQVSLLKLEHLESVSTEISGLRTDLTRFGDAVEAIATAPAQRTSDPVALEHQVLGEAWKQFRANSVLRAAFDDAGSNAAWEPLLEELPKYIPTDLQPSFEAVYAPCREHRLFVKKVALIPRIIERKIPRLPTDAEELRRTRELAGLLAAAQSGTDGANPLNFRFKRWVTDTFLPFADLYLQRCQQADLEKRGGDLRSGADLVRQLLQLASVEPIEVKLGETAFDSTRHIGRATSNDPRYADGVITGVVRNGFIEGGQQVIRQPEVIVNRMR